MNASWKTPLLILSLAGTTAMAAPSFSAASSVPAVSRPGGVALADFDGDGDLDMAVTTDAIDKINIYLNTGGVYGAPFPILTGGGTGASDIIASDVDQDGDTDLVVILKGIDAVRVYINTGGIFTPGSTVGVGSRPVDLTVGDLNGDGADDFATANRDAATFTTLTNNGAGVFTAASFAGGGEPRGVAISDFNGDGIADVAVSDKDNRVVNVHSGAAGFAVTQGLPVNPLTRPDGIVASDLNGDGLMDLAATTSDPIFNSAAVWLNTCVAMGPRFDYLVNGLNPGGIAAADLDGDGDIDLVTSNQDSNTMSTLENIGAGTFSPGVAAPTGIRPGNIALGDIDANGGTDIAITNRDSNDVSLFMNLNGAAACSPADLAEPFGELNFFDVSAFLSAFTAGDIAADLNGDGAFNFFDVSNFLSLFSAGCP